MPVQTLWPAGGANDLMTGVQQYGLWFPAALNVLVLLLKKAEARQSTIIAVLSKGNALNSIGSALRTLPMNRETEDALSE